MFDWGDYMIYLDYAANCPVDQEVLDVYYKTALNEFANPNSTHKLGNEANNLLIQNMEEIAKVFNVTKDEIIFTSGATESNNLVIQGVASRYRSRGKHIIVSSMEHQSIIAPASHMPELGYEFDLVPVNKDGRVDLDTLKSMIRKDTILVSICGIDSELGIRQPVEEIGELLKEYKNTIFHVDASQVIGRCKMDFSNVDLITVTPHKFYGLNSFGMLVKKKGVSLHPIIRGGKSVTVYRSGTPDVAMVVALNCALQKAMRLFDEREAHVIPLADRIKEELMKHPEIHMNTNEYSVPFVVNFSVPGTKSEKLIAMLEEKEIYVSAKASCCPTGTPSKPIYAVYHDKNIATSSIRVSLSHLTTQEEVDGFIKEIQNIFKEKR